MNEQRRLGTENILKLMAEFSIPAIIGMIVNTLYNIIDRIFIGHIPQIGELAIAGVGITLPLMTIILGFGLLIGIGTATRISINLGEHKKDLAEKHLGNAFILIIITSILLTFFGTIFIDPLLKAFGASENIIVYGRQYIQIIFFGCIFNMIGFGLNHSIRSDGSPKIAMMSMLIGAITNIALDPIFIFALGLGVRGGAIATVISQAISGTWVLYYFTKGKSVLKIRKQDLRPDKKIVLSIFTIGISPFSMQLANSLVQVVANKSLQHYGGDIAIAVMTVVNSLAMIFTMPIFGLNQGMQPIIGYNYGAKNYERVKQTVKYGIIVATIIVTSGFIIVHLIPNILIGIFNNSPELLEVGVHGMKIYLFMMPLIGSQIIITNYFQSIGKVKVSMFLSLLRQVIVLVPCMIILPLFKGLTGVWLAGPTADFIAFVVTIIMYKKISSNLENN